MMTKPRLQSKNAPVAIIVGLLILCCGNAMGAIIYIPDKYPTIQAAIDAAFEGDIIIVRDGTYLLTAAIDFKGKAITVKSQNGASNCILDGQAKTRIFYFHGGETRNSVVSGFTIQNGQAGYGAGIYCEQSSPALIRCIIRNNQAIGGHAFGGGIYCLSSSPLISSCIISGNKAYESSKSSDARGGGIYCNASSPTIVDCSISGNTAMALQPANSMSSGYSFGGGIFIIGGSPVISNSTISGNSLNSSGYWGAASYGGGIYCEVSSLNMVNCFISNNSGKDNGGGICFYSSVANVINSIINGNTSANGAAVHFGSSPSYLTNCIIVRNISTNQGSGGLHCDKSSPKFINGIVWENGPTQIYQDSSSNPVITYSDVDGGYSGTGNINAFPNFVNIATQDFHLTSGSPCVNVGSNSAPYLSATDKDGNPRISNGVVDMGAYEYQGCPLPGAAGLVSPAGSETTASPTYTWKMDVNATYYFLWVDDSTGNKVKLWYTSAQANCNASTSLCSVTPQVALAAGKVQWWIQTWNSCGYGAWSSAASFTAGALPGAAILVSPKGPNISTTPTYTWNAVPTATYYLLWVRDYTGFPRIQTWYSPTQLGCAAGTGTCSVKSTTTLLPGNALWWVQTYNSTGYGPWSDEMNFTVTGAAAPGKAVLMSPSGSITTASPIFKWNAVPSAAWYFLYVQDATAFGGRVTSWFPASQAGCASGTGTCSFTPDTVLAPGTATWWIRTWSDLGTGPWSDGMSFTVPSASAASAHTP